MSWDFETDPSFREQLDWAVAFVRDRVALLDACYGNPFDKGDADAMRIFRELRSEVKAHGLWAPHLPPEFGGQACTQVQLALLNEVIGPSRWAPTVFGYHPHESGIARMIDKYGNERQRRDYVWPLLDGDITTCYSMNEPMIGATKSLFKTRAVRDGDSWILDGEKWFSANASFASFFLTIAVTNPDVDPTEGFSMFVIPAGTPGITVLRNASIGGQSLAEGSYGYVRYEDVRLPVDALLGTEGQAYLIAQTRGDAYELYYPARGVGQLRAAFEMMCERAVSFETRSGPLRDFQMTKEKIADSWIQIEQFRLLVLQAAWTVDRIGPQAAFRHILAAKAALPGVLRDVVQRAMHLHGVIGVSSEMPFASWLTWAEAVAVSDGPTELRKLGLADFVLADWESIGVTWPRGHIPTAREKWAAIDSGALGTFESAH